MESCLGAQELLYSQVTKPTGKQSSRKSDEQSRYWGSTGTQHV